MNYVKHCARCNCLTCMGDGTMANSINGEPADGAVPCTCPPHDHELFIVIACHYSTQGVALFWCPDAKGYTIRLEDAGRFCRADAERHTRNVDRLDIAVPEAIAEAACFSSVSDGDAHSWLERPKEIGGIGPSRAERREQIEIRKRAWES